MELRCIYAMALRLHILPQQVFDMPESDFAYLMATLKMESDEQERKWRTQARK